jgi:hypothetical protein
MSRPFRLQSSPLRQPLSDRERLLKGLSRLVALADGAEQIAHPLIGNREVALVVGAIGLGLRQPLGNRERLLKGLSRLNAFT